MKSLSSSEKFLEFWNYNKIWNHTLFSKIIKYKEVKDSSSIKTLDETASLSPNITKAVQKESLTWKEKLKKSEKDFHQYVAALFLVKNLVLKFALVFIFAILIFSLGFGLRYHFLYVVHDFVLNPGVGMSIAANQPVAVVYTIQALPCIFALLAFLFIPQWWVCFGFIMMFFGGLMNIIDRSMGGQVWNTHWLTKPGHGILEQLKNKVVDYFNAPNSIFNIADVFVLLGVGFVVASIILFIVFLFLKENYKGVYPWEHGFKEVKANLKKTDQTNKQFNKQV